MLTSTYTSNHSICNSMGFYKLSPLHLSKDEEGKPDTGKVTCPRSYIKLVPGRASANP